MSENKDIIKEIIGEICDDLNKIWDCLPIEKNTEKRKLLIDTAREIGLKWTHKLKEVLKNDRE